MTNHENFAFWHLSPKELLEKLHAVARGLTEKEAAKRLKKLGKNQLASKNNQTLLSLFLLQFKNPLVLLLLGAAILSFCLKGRTDALIILIIVIASGLLSFFQEKGAVRAVEKLKALVKVRVHALRDGQEIEVELENIVPGDIVSLSAGDIVPGDCLILSSKNCYVNEATLTGESFLIEKKRGSLEKMPRCESAPMFFSWEATSQAVQQPPLLSLQAKQQSLAGSRNI